jgi:hypothetical protein
MLLCEIPVVDGMATMGAVQSSRMGSDGVRWQFSLGRRDDRRTSVMNAFGYTRDTVEENGASPRLVFSHIQSPYVIPARSLDQRFSARSRSCWRY